MLAQYLKLTYNPRNFINVKIEKSIQLIDRGSLYVLYEAKTRMCECGTKSWILKYLLTASSTLRNGFYYPDQEYLFCGKCEKTYFCKKETIGFVKKNWKGFRDLVKFIDKQELKGEVVHA